MLVMAGLYITVIQDEYEGPYRFYLMSKGSPRLDIGDYLEDYEKDRLINKLNRILEEKQEDYDAIE